MKRGIAVYFLILLSTSLVLNALYLPDTVASSRYLNVDPDATNDNPEYMKTVFPSIFSAIVASSYGDTICVPEGYCENTWAEESVVLDNTNLKIQCLSGNSKIISEFMGPLIRADTSLVSIEGISFETPGSAILAYNSDIFIDRCEFADCRVAVGAVSVNKEASIRIYNSLFHDNDTSVGLWSLIGANMDVEISNCTIDSGNTFALAASSGFGTIKAMLKNCIVSSNKEGILLNNADAEVFNSVFWDNGSCDIDISQEEIIEADPLFLPSGYLLSPTSPCIDAGSFSTGGYAYDLVQRPLGKGPDIGAYEQYRISLLHLSDLHLLAPDGQMLMVGQSYDALKWEHVESMLEEIGAASQHMGGIDVVVVTGDIVNWATDSMWAYPVLGQSYSDESLNGTYKGYEAFKLLVYRYLGDVAIFEVPGNHDYREDPYRPWEWLDRKGISDNFYDSYNHESYKSVCLDEVLGITLTPRIRLILLDSGTDALGMPNGSTQIIMDALDGLARDTGTVASFLASATSMYDGNIMGAISYGSGFENLQMDALQKEASLHQGDYMVICCHNPIIFPHMTPLMNLSYFLQLVASNNVGFVLSGHTHVQNTLHIEWNNGSQTSFLSSGATYQGHYNIVSFVSTGENNAMYADVIQK